MTQPTTLMIDSRTDPEDLLLTLAQHSRTFAGCLAYSTKFAIVEDLLDRARSLERQGDRLSIPVASAPL